MKAVKNLENLAQLFAQYLRTTKGLDSLLKNGRLISMEPGKVVFETEISEEHGNRSGGMHGAFGALLVDSLTGAAIITQATPNPERPLYSGVSVGLNMTYIKGVKCGETVIATAEVSKLGKTLAFTTCEIRSKDDGKVLATGQHTKYIA